MSWRLERLARPDVRHLELWCAPTGHGPLWQQLGADAVAARRARGESADAIGADLGALLAEPLARLAGEAGAGRVWLGGGLSRLPGLEAALAERLGLRLHLSREGRFAGEPGGRALLRAQACAGGVVVDVGQTGVKVSTGGARTLVERDRDSLPLLLIDPQRAPAPSPGRRRAAVTLITGAALAGLATAGCDALLLALPGPILPGPRPGPCSYGWQDDAELFVELLASLDSARRGGGRVLLLNDAELAAESARVELPAPAQPTLCVTLGFGPGAALLGAASPAGSHAAW